MLIFGHLIAQNDKQNLKLHIFWQLTILCTHISFPSYSYHTYYYSPNKCHATLFIISLLSFFHTMLLWNWCP